MLYIQPSQSGAITAVSPAGSKGGLCDEKFKELVRHIRKKDPKKVPAKEPIVDEDKDKDGSDDWAAARMMHYEAAPID